MTHKMKQRGSRRRKQRGKQRHKQHTVHPVPGRLEVVGSPVPLADNGGGLWRLGVGEASLSIAAGPCLRKPKSGPTYLYRKRVTDADSE